MRFFETVSNLSARATTKREEVNGPCLCCVADAAASSSAFAFECRLSSNESRIG
jgi:hypothetical protein